MHIKINNLNYYFSTKQFQEVRRLIKKRDWNFTDDSYENNKEEYKTIMRKYNIFPRSGE